MADVVMTIGHLRRILSEIGTGHDAKPIAIASAGKVSGLDANDVAVQGDRILFYAMALPKPQQQPKRLFVMHTDPGHGWLAVSSDDLIDVGLSDRSFSRYSYRKLGWFYLEEDCDAAKFVNAYQAKHGEPPAIRESYAVQTPIRNYQRIRA